MSPTHSNGRRSVSCHTGLNPLFLTALVRNVVIDRCVWPAVAEGVDPDEDDDELEEVLVLEGKRKDAAPLG